MNAPSTPGNPILRAEHLSRVVNTRVLLDDINFELYKSQVLAITGPSGSGKSSLLRLLNRLDEPTSGTVYVGGTDYRRITPRDLRRSIGMVTQRAYLFPGTVARNLRYGPAQRGEALPQKALEELLQRVGLSGYGERNVANLSGGEAQRVSLARALANSPEVLLLDEPTSALDDAAKHEIEALLENIMHAQALTCIVVTHDSGQAARLAERALLLVSGRVVRSGPVEEVLRA